MPTTPKSSSRRGQESEKSRRNKLTGKASSFHGRVPVDVPEPRIRRPNTLPNLLGAGRNLAGSGVCTEARPKLTKLLLNVTVQGSVGAVQVLISPESSVGELISVALLQYVKEGRRPKISSDSSDFDLHYSQFSLESLDREERVMELGSRNFFLCNKKSLVETGTSSSCSNEVASARKSGPHWLSLKFMDFLL